MPFQNPVSFLVSNFDNLYTGAPQSGLHTRLVIKIVEDLKSILKYTQKPLTTGHLNDVEIF